MCPVAPRGTVTQGGQRESKRQHPEFVVGRDMSGQVRGEPPGKMKLCVFEADREPPGKDAGRSMFMWPSNH